MGMSRRCQSAILFFFATFFTLVFLKNCDYLFVQRVQQIVPSRVRVIQFQTKPQKENFEVDSKLTETQFQHEDGDIEMRNIKEFFQYVENPSQSCNHSKVFGGVHGKWGKVPVFDGEKVVCLDKEFNINPKKCLVYSFGINNEWSFDDAMARFGCHIYAFDPTMNKKSHKRGEKIDFYNIGIGNKDGFVTIKNKKCEVKRFTSIMAHLGHLQDDIFIDYLKMDVEGAEVPFLEDVLENSTHILKRIKQIGMEIHVGRYNETRNHIFQKNYRLFKLLERIGFRLFSSKWNPFPFNKYWLDDVGRTVNGYYELVWGLWPSS